MNSSSPLLPIELEREIFETAARFYPKTICNLSLVAHRVYEWIDGIKHTAVMEVDGKAGGFCPVDVLLRKIRSQSKPASFFHHHVRYLYIAGTQYWAKDSNDLRQLLSACSGTHNLVLFVGTRLIETLLPSLGVIELRHLALLQASPLLASHISPHMAMFTFLTHFYIVNNPLSNPNDATRLPPFLAHLPALTHFAMGAWDPVGNRTVKLVKDILVACQTLQVLVLVVETNVESCLPIYDDRFLYQNLSKPTFIRGWVANVRGGRDFWARADAFVAKKQRGEIHRTRCWIDIADGIGLGE